MHTYHVRYTLLTPGGGVREEAVTCRGDIEARMIIQSRYGARNVMILYVTRMD